MQKNFNIKNVLIVLLFLSIIILLINPNIFKPLSLNKQVKQKKIVKIAIGYQSPCAQTWGALVIKNKKLFEKLLNDKFNNYNFKITWQDYNSGPPITNNMIAGKIQIGFMGDMPLLINASKGQNLNNYRSEIIALDGKGLNGKNQALMTNINNNYEMKDLAGQKVSTIFGSSAHRILLEILNKYDLLNDVEIINQDVISGMTAIEQNKIAAHATWDPYPRYMINRKKAKYLVDGSESEVDYLDGVIVDSNWANNNHEITTIFLESLIQAHSFIRNNPNQAASIFQDESGFPYNVCLQEAKEIRWDAYIYDKDIRTLQNNVEFLNNLEKIEPLNLEQAINPNYLKTAIENQNLKHLSEEELSGEWIENEAL
jgi:NitT/TauT family transport system substrate-binding protein